MSQPIEIPLILGGHTFISQLGNDPPASEQQQHLIVESCLNRGIRWFDTTYQPERVALGKVLHSLGRRERSDDPGLELLHGFRAGRSGGRTGLLHSRAHRHDLRAAAHFLRRLLSHGAFGSPREEPTAGGVAAGLAEARLCPVPGALDFGSGDHRTLSKQAIRFDSQSDRSTSRRTTPLPCSRPARCPDGKHSPRRRFFADGNWTGWSRKRQRADAGPSRRCGRCWRT